MNDSTYGGCGPKCQLAPFCGDGIVQAADGELCDDGKNLGGYEQCGPGCKPGPYCGDGIVNGPEQCDDGPKNGTQGDGCSATCTTVIIQK